jgi:hypothetical protein
MSQLNLNDPIVGGAIQLVTDVAIRLGNGNDHAKEVERAQKIIGDVAALQAANSGNLDALTTAINSALNGDPVVQSLLIQINSGVVAKLSGAVAGTVLGGAITDVLNTVLGYVSKAAQAYVAKYGQPAAAPAVAAPAQA